MADFLVRMNRKLSYKFDKRWNLFANHAYSGSKPLQLNPSITKGTSSQATASAYKTVEIMTQKVAQVLTAEMAHIFH